MIEKYQPRTCTQNQHLTIASTVTTQPIHYSLYSIKNRHPITQLAGRCVNVFGLTFGLISQNYAH